MSMTKEQFIERMAASMRVLVSIDDMPSGDADVLAREYVDDNPGIEQGPLLPEEHALQYVREWYDANAEQARQAQEQKP